MLSNTLKAINNPRYFNKRLKHYTLHIDYHSLKEFKDDHSFSTFFKLIFQAFFKQTFKLTLSE